MTKRHQNKKEKCIMNFCGRRFTPEDNPNMHKPENGHRVCRLQRCVSLQNSIDAGKSDVPPWHPDYLEIVDLDEDYFRWEEVDDIALTEEQQRIAMTEAQAMRRERLPYNERRSENNRISGNKTYPHNQLILNYDNEVVATFNSAEARTNAFMLAEARHIRLKAHIEKQIQDFRNKYKRSG